MIEQFENVCFGAVFTCSENVRARSVSTPPAGGSTISWERRILLEPYRHKQSLYLHTCWVSLNCSFYYHSKKTIIFLINHVYWNMFFLILPKGIYPHLALVIFLFLVTLLKEAHFHINFIIILLQSLAKYYIHKCKYSKKIPLFLF